MKKLFFILLLLPFFGHAQQSWTWVTHNDSLFAKYGSVDSFYYTGAPIKGTFWQFIRGNVSDNPALVSVLSGKADAADLSGYSVTSHTHTFASLTSKPTTLSGYGITDAVANTITVNGHALSGNVTVTTTDLSLNNVTNTSDASKPVSTAQQTALDLKANLASPTFTGTVGGITASMIGLGNVTNESKATMHTNATFTGTFTAAAGSIANAALANSAVANLSGTNTGDNAVNSNYSGLVSNVTHTGDATGSTALTVVKINGTSLAGLGTGILKNTTGTGVPSIAVAGDFPTLNQNTSGTAAGWTTGRTVAITGDLTYTSASLDGTGNVTAAGTLATVNSNTGSFGTATQSPTITVNGKGLITAASNTTITPAESSVTFTDITTNNFSTTKHGFVPKGTNVGNFLKDDGTWAAAPGTGTVTTMSIATANGVSGSVANAATTPAVTLTLGAITPTTVAPTSTITTAAGTTSIAPLNLNSASVLRTTSAAADVEYDQKNLYFTTEATMGRGYVPAFQRFRLTSNGSTISTIANFFGATSNPTLVSGAEYLIEIDCYYTNTTTGTVTFTFTNSAAPTSQNIHARFSPVAGIVVPAGSAAATYLEGDVQADATAAKAFTTTGSLTNATTQWAHFTIHLYNNTGTSLKIQATKLVGGTITPLAGSYWTCTRVPSTNTGIFVN